MTPRRQWGDDTGSVSLYALLVTLTVFLLIGLITDGAGRVRALADANHAAREAARAAGQALNGGDLISGDRTPDVDTAAAAHAARAYLDTTGVTGTVTVSGTTITVTTTTTYANPLISNLGHATLTGHATARPARHAGDQ